MKRVYSSSDRAAAHHAKNLLQGAGLDVMVRNDMLSSAMGELPPAECQVEIWVLSDGDARRAEELLKDYFSAPGGAAWRCACGEAIEGQFSQCWSCGAQRAA